MKKVLCSKFTPLFIAFPPIIIGVIAMFFNKVPMIIWGQNIACLIILGLVSYFILSKETKSKKTEFNTITIIVAVLFILLTFVDSGFQGVNRWISMGPIKFYVASIVIPILIIELCSLSQLQHLIISVIIIIFVSILLALQPDASQLTAFIIPMIILLWGKTNKITLRLGIIAILSIIMVNSWVHLDILPPVSYVEKILSLVGNMGILWLSLGVISLIILPLPFIFFAPKNLRLSSTCIGIYFIIILISTIFGNFPVPLMGYGISPIIGYFVSITWFVKAKIYS
ncbi:cell division protein [Clostridium sp.]|uniref:cell division protein n=1 Tax=Clostridium sp. TaxID=1506 RepID=UPI003D6D32A2